MIETTERRRAAVGYDSNPVVTMDEQLAVALSGRAMTVHVDRVGAADRIAALGAAAVDPDTHGKGRLAALLMRVRLQHDRGARKEASILFSHWLRSQREFRKWKIRDGDALVLKFASAVVLEWQQGRRWRAAERAIALGVPMETYTRHWPMRFDWAAVELDRAESEIAAPLRKQLSRRIVPTQK